MNDFDSRARKAAEAVRHQVAENVPQYGPGIRRARRSPARVAIPSAVAAAVVGIAGIAVALPRGGGANGTVPGPVGRPPGGEQAAFALTGALKPFNTCDAVVKYFKDQAPDYLIERARRRHGSRCRRYRRGDSPDAALTPRLPLRRRFRRRTRQRTSKRQASMSLTS